MDSCELTILMPCLNEAETLGQCLTKAQGFLGRTGIRGEVIVADNGSTDGSQAIATSHGARVVAIKARGYGSALIGGIRAARGTYVIMGDSDDSYDFSNLDQFVEKLRAGFEIVMGNRFRGGIMPGAMPPLHRYLGNPVLSTVGRVFFRSPCSDFHCGLRGFRRDSILRLDLQAPGMEFASEMVVKATINKLRFAEVPIKLHPDGRSRPPHLRSWRDGWRHLRFLLLFSPRSLFLYPGFVMFTVGLMTMAWLLPGSRMIGRVTFDIHTLLYAAMLVPIGFQSMFFWAFAKIHGMREGIVPPDPSFRRLSSTITLENGLIAGAALLVVGIGLAVYALGNWQGAAFGSLSPEAEMRFVIPSVITIILAFQVIYGSFFMSVLEIRAARNQPEIALTPSPRVNQNEQYEAQ
jgi:glycosyltransferase involved in cell wall biosynthesis